MFFIFFFILFIILFYIFAFPVLKKVTEDGFEVKAESRKAAGRKALVWFIVFALIITFAFSFKMIQAGNIGVVYEFGRIVSQIGEGPHFIPPWRNITIGSIQIQKQQYPSLACFSTETQEVFIDATLNWRVDSKAIQELYRNVGINFSQILIEPRILQNFKDETVKYKSVDIAPNRENIRTNIREKLKKELNLYSIEIVDLLIDNIEFNPEFKTAIEKKQIATQQALEEEQRIAVVKRQAEQAIEKARGEGESILVKAQKEAEANKALSKSITEQLIQYQMVQKLAPNVQVIVLPSGQNFLFDFKSLLPTPE